jgi:hypothetical protein
MSLPYETESPVVVEVAERQRHRPLEGAGHPTDHELCGTAGMDLRPQLGPRAIEAGHRLDHDRSTPAMPRSPSQLSATSRSSVCGHIAICGGAPRSSPLQLRPAGGQRMVEHLDAAW